ncbi:hypothetical protein Ddc_04703 [Ditylenchus destructor]|nr:hypothetical protein Ddc_04703 [Ditylenchus destructor]
MAPPFPVEEVDNWVARAQASRDPDCPSQNKMLLCCGKAPMLQLSPLLAVLVIDNSMDSRKRMLQPAFFPKMMPKRWRKASQATDCLGFLSRILYFGRILQRGSQFVCASQEPLTSVTTADCPLFGRWVGKGIGSMLH